MDNQVLNRVEPVVDQAAVEAAALDAQQRRAALEREEAARRLRDSAVIGSFNRAPDRLPVDATITDPDAPQVTPDIPPPPFEAVGLDETALRTIRDAGVEMSPSTQKQSDSLDAQRAAQEDAGRDAGGVTRVDANPAERAPSDAQTTQTASSVQTSEPNVPNSPDQPSRPNQPNVPAGMRSGSVDTGTDSGVSSNASDYEAMTVKDLKATAAERNVEIPSDARKAEIIDALEVNDGK